MLQNQDNNKVKNILTRTITGCVYVALIAAALLLPNSEAFVSVFVIFTVLGLIEFYHLANKDIGEKKLTLSTDIVGGVILFLSVYWKYCFDYKGDTIIWILPYLIYLLARFVMELYTKESNPILNLAHSIMGQIYVALPLALLNVIYFIYSPKILLAMFIFIWLNDTGAYCVGCTLGKHKLFPRISPNKSWEGFIGGLAVCVIGAIIFRYCLNTFFNGPDIVTWIGFGIVISIFGTWGDLCESLIKRTVGVKDASHILPGHGGILDRIDSLLLVAPSVLAYLLIMSCINNL